MIESIVRYLSLACLCAGLAACGGGGGDNLDTEADFPGGSYEGTLNPDDSDSDIPAVAIVGENGRMLLVNQDATLAYFGRLQGGAGNFSGSYRAFNMFGTRGESITTGDFSGLAEARRSLDGRYTGAEGSGGAFSFDYRAIEYEYSIPLKTLAGNWSGGDYSLTFSERGEFSGTSAFGCSYRGRIAIIDAAYSPYNLQLTETCGTTSRTMTGLGITQRLLINPSSETILVLGASDTEEARLIGLRR